MEKNCGCKKFKREKVTREISIAGTRILVQDAPADVCLKCGEIYFDGKYILELEKQVKKMDLQPA